MKTFIHKLKAYGLGCMLRDWVSAFRLEKSNRVVIEDSSSTWCDVDSRVQQGSALGLFILYINDLPHSLRHG